MNIRNLVGLNLTATIHRVAELVSTAGATWLTLGALVALLGAGVVAWLLRKASGRVSLIGALAWLAFCVVVLVIVAAVQLPSVLPLVSVNVAGNAPIEGRRFLLDLGAIPSTVEQRVNLDLQSARRIGLAQWHSPDQGVDVSWSDGKSALALSPHLTEMFTITIKPAAPNGTEQHDLTLTDGDSLLSLIRVKFKRMLPQVSKSSSSGPKPSGLGKNFSPPYRVSVHAPSGDYAVSKKSIKYGLTGDRTVCGDWASCVPQLAPNGESATLIFTLQGHDECLSPLRHCDAIRLSEGHISALFDLKPRPPILSELAN